MPIALLVTIVVALIGALSAVLGAVLVFVAKARFDHPVAQAQTDISAGALLLSQVTYLNTLLPQLQKEVAEQADQLEHNRKDCEAQIAAVRAEAAQTIAAKQHDLDTLGTAMARLLLRVDELEQHQGEGPGHV